MGSIGSRPCRPRFGLTGKIFGREKAPLVYGWVFTAHQIGAAVATYGAGAARTGLSTYLPAFYAARAMCLVAALVALAPTSAGGPTPLAPGSPRTAAA